MLHSLALQFLRGAVLCCLVVLARAGHMVKKESQCILTPGGAGVDDSPAILDAFKQCGHNGHIVFQNTTYHIEKVMNTTGLVNCVVDIKGTLLWGTNISYWLNNSLPIGYQNQSSAWFLGGTNLTV
ncbi:hypothetical protein FS749_011239, partial [Ceratobasidium sp. UAMH 11750]